MTSNLKGNIGEAKVVSYFIENGYEVFIPFGTATSIDLIVILDGVVSRVSVKTTSKVISSGRYEVDIRQTTRQGNIPFDKNSCDLLLVYVLPEQRIVELKSEDINNTTSIVV